MTADSTILTLNRLLVLHSKSLAQYLRYASPTWHRGDGRARKTMEMIANNQQSIADRLGEMIIDLGGTVIHGSFPMPFTGYHDLSFDFLLGKLIQEQRRTIVDLERCVSQLTQNAMARALAEESLGAAKGHLESLLELQQTAGMSATR